MKQTQKRLNITNTGDLDTDEIYEWLENEGITTQKLEKLKQNYPNLDVQAIKKWDPEEIEDALGKLHCDRSVYMCIKNQTK